MQQVLIHVIPVFFAYYAFMSLFGRTKMHWVPKILIAFVMLVASQYPALSRSYFGNSDDPIPYFGVLLLCWLFATQLLMILAAFGKDLYELIGRWRGWPAIKKPATLGIILTTIATSLATWGTYKGVKTPEVMIYDVAIENLDARLEGFRIVQLSDIHASALLNRDRLEKVVEITNGLNPDLIAVTGDIVDGRVGARWKDVLPLKKLKAPYGVWGVEGNHEHYVDYDGWMQAIPKLGIHILHNENVTIDVKGAKLALVGITDPMAKRYKRDMPDIEKAMTGVKAGTPTVLLSHQIKYSREYAAYPINVQLSGHTHGGQIFGMHWLAQFLNAGFVRDHYDVNGMALYVNRGTGLWSGFPIRLGVESEITLVRLTQK